MKQVDKVLSFMKQMDKMLRLLIIYTAGIASTTSYIQENWLMLALLAGIALLNSWYLYDLT